MDDRMRDDMVKGFADAIRAMGLDAFKANFTWFARNQPNKRMP